ncbi:MAG: permease-like cell division protein FtsX [Lachnospiraceae bacterium]|nr:permease-like cell division protein FtsX [Lachnospiraceae bacterium]
MKLRTLVYSGKQGVKSIYRNRLFSLAAIGTITASLILFGFFFFITENLSHIVDRLQTEVAVSVFFEPGASDEVVANIKTQIESRAEVAEVVYISPEEALEIYKENNNQGEEFSETFKDVNPLEEYDSYTVYLNDVDMQESLVSYIERLEGVRTVKNNENVAKNFSVFNSAVGYVCTAIIVLLIGIATFLISNTISTGISVRAGEIEIMKNIGATDFFIRAPFLVEGILIGFLGALVPIGILYPIYGRIEGFVAEKLGNTLGGKLEFLPVGEVFGKMVPIMLAIGVGIGAIGTMVTLRKKIRRY